MAVISSSQTGKPGMRYELTDYEWTAIKPMLLWLRVIESMPY